MYYYFIESMCNIYDYLLYYIKVMIICYECPPVLYKLSYRYGADMGH